VALRRRFQEILLRILPFRARLCEFAVATAVLINACATSPPIHREANPAVTLHSDKTVGFIATLANDRSPYESLLTQHLKDAICRSLKAKGYVFSDRTPDLLINFFVNIQNNQEVNTRSEFTFVGDPGGYYGYRTGYYRAFGATVETVYYKLGTLTIDLVDAKQRVLAWTATAEGRVSNSAIKDPGPAIDTLVIDMMIPLPRAARRH
jgi:Domain of unknown function (DUF4136)